MSQIERYQDRINQLKEDVDPGPIQDSSLQGLSAFLEEFPTLQAGTLFCLDNGLLRFRWRGDWGRLGLVFTNADQIGYILFIHMPNAPTLRMLGNGTRAYISALITQNRLEEHLYA